jgi:hypothetical protein
MDCSFVGFLYDVACWMLSVSLADLKRLGEYSICYPMVLVLLFDTD